ncbi:MAG: hypothetical protein JJU11_07475 [Candidatus Sumerlaeia bacterium]|nr:hypothetical protein [Candidatus Sumerlaeia bacterium]
MTNFRLLFPGLVLLAGFFLAGCANRIDTVRTVIQAPDPDTEMLRVDDSNVDGATLRVRLRYTSELRDYDVTQIYETPWRAKDELYEVPVGLVTIVPSFLWWGISTVVGFDPSISRGPLNWSAAGLNPFYPVKNGMFAERYRIREQPGSRRLQRQSRGMPYDAVVAAEDGRAYVRFGNARTGTWKQINVGEELQMRINMLEAVEHLTPAVIRSGTADEFWIQVAVRPGRDWDVLRKELDVRLYKADVEQLTAARPHVMALLAAHGNPDATAERDAALTALEEMGFGREATQLIRSGR